MKILKILNQHGGEVSVDSEADKGTYIIIIAAFIAIMMTIWLISH